MGQPQHAVFLTSILSAKASPEMSAAFSKRDAVKLRVGSTPASFIRFTSTAVPNWGSA